MTWNGSQNFQTPPATGVWDGEWHHVMGTFDGTTLRLCLDGTPVAGSTPMSGQIRYGLVNGDDFVSVTPSDSAGTTRRSTPATSTRCRCGPVPSPMPRSSSSRHPTEARGGGRPSRSLSPTVHRGRPRDLAPPRFTCVRWTQRESIPMAGPRAAKPDAFVPSRGTRRARHPDDHGQTRSRLASGGQPCRRRDRQGRVGQTSAHSARVVGRPAPARSRSMKRGSLSRARLVGR